MNIKLTVKLVRQRRLTVEEINWKCWPSPSKVKSSITKVFYLVHISARSIIHYLYLSEVNQNALTPDVHM